MEAEIKIHPEWLQKEPELMKYISSVIMGGVFGYPIKKDSGYGWQLDASNNYWAEIRDGKLIVASRYANVSDPKFHGLVVFLTAWLE